MRVTGAPLVLLRLEGAVVLAGAILAYRAIGASWLVFALLFLMPDVSMLGYLRGPRLGSVLYNTTHTYLAPALLAVLAWTGVFPDAWALCLIWAGHIGLDRSLGYGLKYESAFRDTHLGPMAGTA